MEYRLTRSERETYYYINDEENNWHADSSIPKDINKLKAQGWTLVSQDYYEDGTVAHARFTAPRFALSPRKGIKIKRNMTDEQRLELAERLKKIRKK